MNLEEAYERFSGELVGYLAKNFRDGGLAEDCAQHAFSRAALSLPDMAKMPEAALRGWLYATARNAALDQMRRQRFLVFAEVPDRPDAQGPDEADREALREAVRSLSEVQQRLVRMRYAEGYNSAEIALATGMTAVNVRYHLMTAMRRLRRELGEEE